MRTQNTGPPKARLAARFEQSSLRVRLASPPDGEAVHEHQSLPRGRFAAHGGALPLRTAAGEFIGTIVISGLPQVQNHAFVVEMLKAHLAARDLGAASRDRPTEA